MSRSSSKPSATSGIEMASRPGCLPQPGCAKTFKVAAMVLLGNAGLLPRRGSSLLERLWVSFFCCIACADWCFHDSNTWESGAKGAFSSEASRASETLALASLVSVSTASPVRCVFLKTFYVHSASHEARVRSCVQLYLCLPKLEREVRKAK